MLFPVSLITLFEQFLAVYLLQTGYSCYLLRQLLKKPCWLSNTLLFAQRLQSIKSTGGRGGRDQTQNKCRSRPPKKDTSWGGTAEAAKLPKYSHWRSCKGVSFLSTLLALFLFLCPPVQGFVTNLTWTVAMWGYWKRKRNISGKHISPYFDYLSF